MRILVFTRYEIESFLGSKDVNLVKMRGGIFSDGKDNLKQGALEGSFWKTLYQEEDIQTTFLWIKKLELTVFNKDCVSIRNI